MALVAICGCSLRPIAPPDPPIPTFAAHAVVTAIAPGLRLLTLADSTGPWRTHALALSSRCVRVRALKGGDVAVGRRTTSELLRELSSDAPAAAVNADFFSFTPPGVPTGAHVENGRLLAGPDGRPAAWSDETGTVRFDTLRVLGFMRRGRDSMALHWWNRPQARGVGLVDAAWGQPLPPAMRGRAWRLAPLATPRRTRGPGMSGQWRVLGLADSLPMLGDSITIAVPSQADVMLHSGDTVDVRVSVVAPGPVWQAVGGRPLLVVDSIVVPDVETEGAEAFRARNPRTALGTSRDGQRQWMVVVDGRQAGAVGMTLRETAELLRALGAAYALNLDGGGSSALVVRDAGRTGPGSVMNRPSDPTGERPVANAWAVVARCRAR
jgi:hypothetical protein